MSDNITAPEAKSLFTHWWECYTRHFIDLSGRASRREYWGFVLFQLLLVYLPLFLFAVIGFPSRFLSSALDPSALVEAASRMWFVGVLFGLLLLVVSIPSICVSVRRLRDSGRTEWHLLVLLIPTLGALLLLIYMLQPSREQVASDLPVPDSLNH